MKVYSLHNVFCTPELPDGDYYNADEADKKIEAMQAEIDELRAFVIEIRDDPELPNSIRDDAENLAYKYRSKNDG